jgi:hypothetical protein
MNDLDEDTGLDGEVIPVEWSQLDKKFLNLRTMDRVEILMLASDLICKLHGRACSARFREKPGDRTQTNYARTLVAAMSMYGGILKDQELEDLKLRIEALERVKGVSKE